MLNVARWIVLVAAGQAAVGELEAARILVAPAMLLVQGVGLVPRSRPMPQTASSAWLGCWTGADRAAVVMLAGALVVGSSAAVVLSWVGSAVTGGRFELSVVAVLGWAAYAASCAAVLPFGSLAAVLGQQRFVFFLRVADSVASLAITAFVVLTLQASTDWVPWLLSVGSIVGGLLCRQVILRPGVGDAAINAVDATTRQSVAEPGGVG